MMTHVTRVVIIDEDPISLQLTRETLAAQPEVELVSETDNLLYGLELVRQNRPDLVFIDLRDPPDKTLEVIRRMTAQVREVTVVVTGPVDVPDVQLARVTACMQAGAREYLPRPIHPDALRQTVASLQQAVVSPTIQRAEGRVVTVFSNKGGLGKTTLAVNLALSMSQVLGQTVALVDLNLQQGDMSTFLDLAPQRTIVDIVRDLARVDEAYLESSLARFSFNGGSLAVLADPIHLEEAEEITADQVNSVLTVLKTVYPYVVVDTPGTFDARTLTALDLADQILTVSMINLPCIRSSQRVLTLFQRLGYDPQKIRLILNRFVPDDEITVEDVEDTLEHPVYWTVPNHYQGVMAAINRGVPIQAIPGTQRIIDSLEGLARKLSGKIHGRPMAPPLPGAPSAQKRKGLMIFTPPPAAAPPQQRPVSLLGQWFGRKS